MTERWSTSRGPASCFLSPAPPFTGGTGISIKKWFFLRLFGGFFSLKMQQLLCNRPSEERSLAERHAGKHIKLCLCACPHPPPRLPIRPRWERQTRSPPFDAFVPSSLLLFLCRVFHQPLVTHPREPHQGSLEHSARWRHVSSPAFYKFLSLPAAFLSPWSFCHFLCFDHSFVPVFFLGASSPSSSSSVQILDSCTHSDLWLWLTSHF